jgi:hypothetical protein
MTGRLEGPKRVRRWIHNHAPWPIYSSSYPTTKGPIRFRPHRKCSSIVRNACTRQQLGAQAQPPHQYCGSVTHVTSTKQSILSSQWHRSLGCRCGERMKRDTIAYRCWSPGRTVKVDPDFWPCPARVLIPCPYLIRALLSCRYSQPGLYGVSSSATFLRLTVFLVPSVLSFS